MTLSTADRNTMAQRSSLTMYEADAVSETLDKMSDVFAMYNVPQAGDDRLARVEAALIRYIQESKS